jgi:predicted nucleotide-binding protein (sugar kinase/HSP70/actin superfamily)
MKIAFPHLGYCWIPLRALFSELGHEVIIPPPISKKTINLGTLHGPEFACYPLKLGLGNFIEALEQGADTLIMGGGIGPCRFGYYAQVQEEILRSLGYDFRMIVVEPPLGHGRQVICAARELKGQKSWLQLARAMRLALAKLGDCDDVYRASLKYRPRVADKAALEKICNEALVAIDGSPDPGTSRQARREAEGAMAKLPQVNPNPLKVALVGEVYLIAEPVSNLYIEKKLGNLGVEVVRHVWLANWLKINIFLDFLRLRPKEGAEKAARPYLSRFVGGHGQHSVGETVTAAKTGMDGVVHVYPFTCTPEIVARHIMRDIARQEKIPLVSFSLDEHSGEAGFNTRLEAFVDLMNQTRAGKEVSYG